MPTIGAGITFGPGITTTSGIVTDNLVLDLDATSSVSTKGQRSIITWSTWVSGTTGSATGYSQNGDGNSRTTDTNPFGYSDVVWDVSNQDVTSNADGGWNTTAFSVDPTKLYRYTTWVRRKTIGNGSFYLGVYGLNSGGSNIGVLNRSNGATNTNPYFYAGGWWGSVNDWYLVVGHVWPAGSGAGSVHPDSGIYTTAGVKIANASDFVWQATNVLSQHRSYLYYSTDVSTNQQWYQPRVDVVDGTQPSIADLLSNAGSTWYDMSGRQNNCTLYSLPTLTTETGYFTFNGTSNYGTIVNNPSLNFSSSQSIMLIMRHTFSSGRKNPWNQAYGGYGTMTHESGANINYYYGTAGTNGSPYTSLNSGTTSASVWNIMCLTRSTSTVTWYKNGVATASAGNAYGALPATSADITIGNGYAGYWAGDMSRALAWTKTLTADEVLEIYNLIKSMYGL